MSVGSSIPKPPRLAVRFLHLFCKKRLVEEIEGDLEEYYLLYLKRNPVWKAKIYYWFHLFSFLRPYSFGLKNNSKFWIMITNNLKFSFRYLLKHRANSLLNILSLSTGIACFLFIFIYLDGELSYDTYHTDSDRIKRVVIDIVNERGRTPDATTPPALAPSLKSNFPEVASATRIFPTWGGKYLMGTSMEVQFYEENVYRVDPEFLEIFSYEVLKGNPDELLDEPSKIVLTESTAKKYFGDENPIGKELTLFNRDNRKKVVSGVIADVPFNSHFTFDFLTPLHFEGRNIDENWGWYNYYTYVKLKEGANHEAFEEKLQPNYLANNPEDTIAPNITYSQPLESIHLNSALKWELGSNSNMNNIKIFMAIGIFILLISLINYLNLTIGGLVRRAKEVGVRKSFGAARINLIGQFITEALIVTVISLLLGGLVAELVLGQMDQLFERNISILDATNLCTFAKLALGVLLIALLAGLYPALHFARMGEVKAMVTKRKRSFDLRQILLIAQFAISAVMLVGTMVVYQQLKYFENSDMGFGMDQVLVIENAEVAGNQQTFKSKLEELSFVKQAGYSNGIVGGLNWTFSLGYPESFLLNYAVVSPDYLNVMEFDIIAGRNFDETIESDKQGLNFIVNEAGLKALNIEMSQVGESVPMASNQRDSLIYGRVLGVVKDFHYSNFRSEIKPYAFFYREDEMSNIVLKMNTSNLRNNLEEVEQVWQELTVGVPFESYFLDQSFAQLHEKEEKMSKVMLYLTLLSIFVSLVGMLAISNIVIKSRLKEVAVRKALGASTSQVVNLFTKNFLILVLIANAIGLPIAYIAMNEWLADFSYRMSLGPMLFVLTLLLSTGLAYLIVGTRSFAAANSELTDRLRDE